MKYYTIQNNAILTAENEKALTRFYDNVLELPLDYEIGKYIIENNELVLNPNWEEENARKERERLDALTLTPADVERALLKAKGWDFEDLKVFLKNKGYTDLQIKAIGVELRANDFFRGATMGEEPNTIRIVDTIGELLGYSSDDMDYLFENKELPILSELTEEQVEESEVE